MLKRIAVVAGIIAVAVVIYTALVQFGATKRTEIESRAQVAIAQAMAGKTTTASVSIQIGTKRNLEEKLPDAAPALTALAGASPTQRQVNGLVTSMAAP